MLNLFSKTADGRKQRLAKMRRRKLASEMQRCLLLEPLEERRLLASDVVIGVNDRPTSYVRTLGVGDVVYSPIQDGVQIAADKILADLDAGLTVTIDTVNAAGLQQGNITLDTVNLLLINAVNSTLSIQADNDVVLGNSRVGAAVGSLTLILNSDRDGSGAGRVEVNLGSLINTNGGDVTIGGGLNPLTTPAVGNLAGSLAGSNGVSIFGTVSAGDGNISILGQGVGGDVDDADGIFVQGTINTNLGDIVLQGTGGNATGVGNDGVALNGGIVASPGGNVSITGIGGGAGINQNGVSLSNSVSASISVTSGSLAIFGAGSATGTGVGVLLAAGPGSIESLGSAPIAINATGSGGSPGLQLGSSIGGANASGDITLITDGFELFGGSGNVQGTGNLLIRPATPAATIGVGGGVGTLNISDTEISSLIDGFASITIGDAAAGSGAVNITSVTFTDPVTIVGGSIDVDNGFTGDGGITLTARDAATAGQDVNINSSFVSDNGGNITINSGDDINLAVGASITAMGSGAVTVNLDQFPNSDAGVGSTATLGGALLGSGGTSINGGTDTDIVSLTGTITSLMIAASGANSGTITADTAIIDYTALEAINVTQQSDNANITFGATSETLTISEPAALSTTVASSAGISVTLKNPVVALTIDTGTGNDTIDVSSLNLTVADGLFIQDGDALPNDTVNLNGALAINTGGLAVLAQNVNVNADIVADAAVTIGNPLVPASLVAINGVMIGTANGHLRFVSPVMVAADSTLNSGNQVEFSSTLDGPGNLTVTAATDVMFAAAVGATTPLASLRANSTGTQVLVSENVTTSGDQIFVSLMTTNGAGPKTFESQAGSVSFQSLLESSPASDITVNSNGIAQFGGNVGVNNPPQSLAVNTAGPFSLGTLINANMDVSISVVDTALDTDDLTILTGGAIVSAGGNVNLHAGDDFESQAGAILNGSVITINVDPIAGDADAVGGTATIDGDITTGVIGGVLNVNGGDDVDTFTPIAPIAASFDGGDPATAPGDTLIIDGAGGTVTISETTLQVGTNPPLNITNLENISLANTSAIDYVGGAGNDTLTLSASPLPATTAVLQDGAGPRITFDPAVATAIGFLGGDGDDTFSVDVTNGVLNTTVTFDGQGNLSTMPGDRISIFGVPAAPLNSLDFTFLNPNDGSVAIDGFTTINYAGLELASSVVRADDVTLNYSAAVETIAVSQVDANITVDSTSGETTTFVAPNNNLTINTGGGADTVTIDGLNVNLTGAFSVNDAIDPMDDTVIFATASSTIGTGRLDLPVPQIQVNVDLSVDGDVSLGSATGIGQIQTSAAISSSGQVVFDEPVNLTGATTVTTDADSIVAFHFAIDGNQDLNVTGGAGVEFLAENGVTTPIANLTATAAMGSIRLDDFTTTGNQTYGSPVTTVAGGGTVDIVSSAGAIHFNSTIDNGSVPADSLNTRSDDVTTFVGAIGATDPLDALTVRASGTIVFATDVNVLNDIDISTSDSGDDNLVIQSPAVISTGLTGSITLNVLDNVDIQAGSTINTSNFGITVDDSTAADDIGTGSIVQIDGTLNVGNPTNVVGGDDADTFSIAVQAGSAFDISGGDPMTSPGDVLVIDAGGVEMTFDVAAGTITVAGAMPIVTTGIERIGLSNSSQLTINGDNGPDTVSIASDPSVAGGDLLAINGSLPYAISTIASLVYNGDDGDDQLTFDVTSGLPTTPVTFHGQAGGGDQITVLGTVITQTLNYTAPGTDGSNGSIDLDGSVVTYTGLEPISAGGSTDTILNLNASLINNAALQNNNGSLGTIELRDLGATFEDTLIPNPTNSLTIRLGDQGDTLAVNTLDAAFAASMIISGGAGIDDVQLDGVTINNTPGRGLDVVGVETLGITNSTFSGNTADVGAGLRVIGGTTTIDGSTFSGNTANGDAADQGGGGIFNSGVMTIQNGSMITDNTASGGLGSGGGILVGTGGTLTVLDSTISGNSANIDGGGLFAGGVPARVTIMDARILGNTAGDSGGGVFINGPTTAIFGTTFAGNQAQGNQGLDGDGGGLFVRGQAESGDFTVTDSSFDSNSALGGGGGAFFVDIDGAINGGSFKMNQVTGNGTTFDTGGGGLAIVGETTVTTVSMSGVTVDGNTSPSAAGIGIADSQVAIDNSVIRNNLATSSLSGAGGIGAIATVQLSGDLLSIQSSDVIDNIAAGEGGGLGIINGDLSVFNTTVSGNRATGGRGGGIGLLNNGMAGTATIRSSTISTNTSFESGGGIAVLDFGLDLENVTISTNNAGTVGGGIGYDNNVDFVNERIGFSTITSNTSQAGGSNIAATGVPIDVVGSIFNDGVSAAAPTVLNSLGFNLDSGNTSGFGDASDLNNADPLLGPLQDNGGPVFTHALLKGSPAIDAAGAMGPAIDARGIARPIDGEPNGTLLFDIGAFEAETPFALIIEDVAVNEDAGTATITVRNVAAVAGGFTVDFANGDGTATQPADYATATGTLTFVGNAGESQTFTVSIVDDAVVENAETVDISLSNPSNVMVDASDTAVLTINDNDTAILTVADVTVDEGAVFATVTVIVNNAVENGFTVDFATSDGSAIQPADYGTATGTLTFVGNAGESQTFTVSIVDDAVVENAETVDISLSNPSNVMVDASDTAVLTINDNDTAILTVADVTVDEGAGFATVTVIVNNAVENGFTVDFATSDGSAIQPADYGTATGTLTFVGNAGESQTFTVSIVDDAVVENAETVDISLSNPSNVMVDASDTAVLTINDNDTAILTVADVTVDEGAGFATVTVIVNNAVENGFTVDFATSDGSAIQPADYGTATGTLTFVGNADESQTFTVPIIDDATAEASETINIGLTNPSSAAIDATDTAVIDILDNESAALTLDDVTVDENAGTATITVSLDTAVAGGLTVDFATTDAAAIQPGDYTSETGMLTFAGTAGETQTFTVSIVNDLLVEPSESVLVSLLNPSNTTVDVSDTALVTIADDDMATIEVADVSVDEQAGNVQVSVAVLNVAVQGGFTVDFTTVDGTATQPDDYALTTGTLTFGSRPSSQSITIPIVGDAIAEENKQFTVVLSNVVPLTANPAPVGSINATDIGTVTITEIPVANVDIGTTIDDTPDPVFVGDNLVYTVTVTNFSSSTATGIVSTTNLPAGLTDITAVASAGTVNVNGNIVTANIPMLASGASETITIRSAVPNTSGVLTANTDVTSTENDTNLTNNSSSEVTTINDSPSAVINGTVTCNVFHNSPNVVNEPIANAVVFLDANSNGRLDPVERRTTTNPSGFYQFDDVAGTAANVTVQVPMSCNTITEEPGVRRSVVAIGHLSRSIASADIDLDGDLDLLVTGDMNLVANQDQSNSLTIVQNSLNGFTSGSVVKLGDRPQSVFAYQPNPMEPALIAVAAVGSSGSGGAVYTIQGQGSAVRQSGNGGPIDVLLDDLNVDGLPDLLSASLHQSILELRLGGSSDVLTVNSQTSQILSIASGNLTGSQRREVVVAGYGHKPDPDLAGQPTVLELYSVNDSGIITKIASVDTPPEAVKVAVVDIIGNDASDGFDDDVDEIAVLFHTGKMLVYPMVNGTIGNPIETQIGNGATAFAFSERLDANNEFIDFNRDGNVDVAVASLGNNSIELYVGDGNGKFSKFSTIDKVYAPSDLVVDDFNGDGFADIAVSSFYSEVDADSEPGISRTGLTTILQLEIASRSVNVVSNSSATEDFLFQSAIPQVLMDTTGDNRISALDALRVINRIEGNSFSEGEQVGVARAATDVNGDGRTSAIDALMIINYLGRESEGEGSQVMIGDLLDTDDDDDRGDAFTAIDMALTQGLV